jgi:hypothetical protein
MTHAIEMRRFLLGEESRFVESVLGRLTLCVLFTTLVGVALSLLFVVNRGFSPFLLKFVVVIGVGLAASFISRRVFAGRGAVMRAVVAAFSALIALGVLSPLTRGFVGLNLIQQYAIATPLDAAIQLIVVGLSIWAGQRAWALSNRTVMVEPRGGEPVEVNLAPARPLRAATVRTTRPRRRSGPSLTSRLNAGLNSAFGSFSKFISPPARVRPARTARRRGRGNAGITLSAEEQHVCPYCLEPVTKRDPRGVKICKACKTWHHADCWAITGVCQVPHEYQS